MAFLHIGPKQFVDSKMHQKTSVLQDVPLSYSAHTEITTGPELSPNTGEILNLRNRVVELEIALLDAAEQKTHIVEIPVEVIKEIKVVVEKEVQVIKEFPVIVEKIVKEFVDVVREVEKIKEVRTEVVREIKSTPKWIYGILLVQTLAIIALLLLK